MKYLTSLLCILILSTAAQAGPLKNLIGKLRPNREPTQVMQQQKQTVTRTRERSVLRQTSPQDDAPRAPKEAAPKTAPKTGASAAGLSGDEQKLIDGCNRLREQHGLPAATVDPVLMRVAAEQLRDPRYSPHNSPEYGSVERHANRYAHWAHVVDAVADARWSDGSLSSPESSVRAWETSPGHLRTILGQQNFNNRWIDRHCDRIGVARFGRHDVAVLGRRADCGCLSGQPCTCGPDCQCGKGN